MKNIVKITSFTVLLSLMHLQCAHKNDPESADNLSAPVSGIYTAANYTPNDSLSVTLWFGFDSVIPNK